MQNKEPSALYSIDQRLETQAGLACREIAIFCTKHYGRQKDIHFEGRNLTVWDASDANIVFDIATGESGLCLT
jgi:hypothetical protein